MNYCFYIVLIYFCLVPLNSLAQTLEGGYWQKKLVEIEYDGEKKIIFSIDDATNIIDYSNVAIQFNNNGTFDGRNILGDPSHGAWELLSNDTVKIVGTVYEYSIINMDTLKLVFEIELINDVAEFVTATQIEHLIRIDDCINHISHRNITIDSGVYTGKNISSNAKLQTNGNIEYKAQNKIELHPGFDANLTTFESAIIDCSN